MNALEVWTIFAPYYRYLTESGGRKLLAHGYKLSLKRVLLQDVVRIIDESSGRVSLEASVGPRTHIADAGQAELYQELLTDRHHWMHDHGFADLMQKRLPANKYPPGNPTEMIAKKRVLIEMLNATTAVSCPHPISQKARRFEQYVTLLGPTELDQYATKGGHPS